MTELSAADSFIDSGDAASALKQLSSAEKKAASPYEILGVYKRYVRLGNAGEKKALKCLERGRRRFKESEEILASYSRLLLRSGRLDKALLESEKLKDSKYKSLYAEAFLRKALSAPYTADELFAKKIRKARGRKNKDGSDASEKTSESRRDLFLDARFAPVYEAAFSASGDDMWIVNAATLLMKSGSYSGACSLYPGKAGSARAWLFWGTVLYDSQRYAESLEALLECTENSSFGGSDADSKSADTLLAVKALASDDYYILGDEAEAEKLRQEVLDVSSVYIDAFLKNRLALSSSVLPLVLMNSALHERKSRNFAGEYERLFELLNYFPDYENSLALYAQYSLDLQSESSEDALKAELRSAGLRTLGMEARDRIPKAETEEVLMRIDEARERRKSAGSSTASLDVLRERFLAQVNRGDESAVKASRVWSLLEKCRGEDGSESGDVVRYACDSFIALGALNEAEDTFRSYAERKYGAPDAEGSSSLESEMAPWEAETAAYLLAEKGDFEKAMEIYRAVSARLSKNGYARGTPVLSERQIAADCLVNAANILYGYGELHEAKDFLDRAVELCDEDNFKAEVLYRSATVSYSLHETENARRLVQYALSINPAHNRAVILLKTIQNQR